MALSAQTYRAWWDLHSWAGVLSSLIVYILFFFGMWTLFHAELTVWQEQSGPLPSLQEVDASLTHALSDGEIDPALVRLNFPTPRAPGYSISYTDRSGVDHGRIVERTGLRETRSEVAGFLYGMHFLRFPLAPGWLYQLAGAASAILLLVVITGILIHSRDLVRHFHQFRPHKRLRVAWSDAHKVLGTLGLPFALVYTFTGAWMGLDSPMMSGLAVGLFAGQRAELDRVMQGPSQDASPGDESHQSLRVASSRLSLGELVARAERTLTAEQSGNLRAGRCRSVYLDHIGSLDAKAHFYCGARDVVLSQHDGSAIAQPGPAASAPLVGRLQELPYTLHFAEFAKTPLRVLYALLALAGCLTILTGNWLWLARREAGRVSWLLRRLTIAIGAGALVASAAMLTASRFGISPSVERQAFWWSWLGALLVACLLRRPRAAWRCLLTSAGLMLVITPPLGALVRNARADVTSSNVATSVDAVLLGLGLLCLWLAGVLGATETLDVG